MAVNVTIRRPDGLYQEVPVIEVGAAAGGGLAGTYPNPTLPDKIAAGTAAYPASITYDSKGNLTAVTPGSAPLGATDVVQAQGSTPGTAQASKNFNIGGVAKSGSVVTGAITASGDISAPSGTISGSVITTDSFIATDQFDHAALHLEGTSFNALQGGDFNGPVNIYSTVHVTGTSDFDAAMNVDSTIHADGQIDSDVSVKAPTFNIGTIIMVDRQSAFPTSGLVVGQTFFSTTYNCWFVCTNTSGIWSQLTTGDFASSFPTVSSGDNTKCPKIRVRRQDRNMVYFWDGTRWLSDTLIHLSFDLDVSRPYATPATATASFTTARCSIAEMDLAANNGLWVEKLSLQLYDSVANTSTNYILWTWIYITATGGASGALTTTVANAQGQSSGTWKRYVVLSSGMLINDSAATSFQFTFGLGGSAPSSHTIYPVVSGVARLVG